MPVGSWADSVIWLLMVKNYLNLQIVSQSVACADLWAHNMEVFCTYVKKNINFSVEVPADDAEGGAASLSLEEW